MTSPARARTTHRVGGRPAGARGRPGRSIAVPGAVLAGRFPDIPADAPARVPLPVAAGPDPPASRVRAGPGGSRRPRCSPAESRARGRPVDRRGRPALPGGVRPCVGGRRGRVVPGAPGCETSSSGCARGCARSAGRSWSTCRTPRSSTRTRRHRRGCSRSTTGSSSRTPTARASAAPLPAWCRRSARSRRRCSWTARSAAVGGSSATRGRGAPCSSWSTCRSAPRRRLPSRARPRRSPISGRLPPDHRTRRAGPAACHPLTPAGGRPRVRGSAGGTPRRQR
jgi:hypothetical protein